MNLNIGAGGLFAMLAAAALALAAGIAFLRRRTDRQAGRLAERRDVLERRESALEADAGAAEVARESRRAEEDQARAAEADARAAADASDRDGLSPQTKGILDALTKEQREQ